MEDRKDKQQTFIDLAPITRELEGTPYKKAFDFCIGKKEINNIALTGPYGSGKSSIIRGLVKSLEEPALEISLASFESKSQVGDKEIELSIVQQMIYSTSVSELPKSRFKRIKQPEKTGRKAGGFLLWLLGVIILIKQWKSLFSIQLLSFEFVPAFLFLFLLFLGTWALFEKFYKEISGISLKKISIKNLEVEQNSDESSSILNRHLDEILYFFQQSDYKLVIFEDIDRFDSPSIFVKLREINTLLNQNSDIRSKHRIQFLYALKDSVFSERERAKFFDFIVPVVPVIGLSNSGDVINTRVKGIPNLERKIDPSFIRDVSEFLNDTRVVNNAFNEFLIYFDEINDRSLDPTALLAVMIYKNMYSEDFEALHHSKGVLFSIITQHKSLIATQKEDIKSEISRIRDRINASKHEHALSEKELVLSYVGTIALNFPRQILGLVIDGNNIHFSDIKKLTQLKPLLKDKNIRIQGFRSDGYSPNSTHITFKNIEDEIAPNDSFEARLQYIRDKSQAAQKKLQHEIENLERQLPDIDGLSLSELLENNSNVIHESINRYASNQPIFENDLGLFRYLLFSGYLNEYYHLYTSIFRANEEWSESDRKYFTTVKARLTPEPGMVIDHPSEVCRRLRLIDFKRPYALNVNLVEHLLAAPIGNSDRTKLMLECLHEHYGSGFGESFMSLFLKEKIRSVRLLDLLIKEWPDYFSICFDTSHTDAEVVTLLDGVDCSLIEQADSDQLLKRYIENNISSIYLSESSPSPSIDSYPILEVLDIEVGDLTKIDKVSHLNQFLRSECLYAINLTNVLYLLELEDVDSDLAKRQTLSVIRSSNNKVLLDYVEGNLETYVEQVMLCNSENKEEPEDILHLLISNGELTSDLKKKIISHQEYKFGTLINIEECLWEHLVDNEKLIPDWHLLMQCYESEEVTVRSLDSFLNNQKHCELLEDQVFKSQFSIEATLKFERYILNNTELNDECYIKLNRALKTRWKNFPSKISDEKKLLLAKNKLIALNEDSFDEAEQTPALCAALIKANYQALGQNILKYTDSLHSIVAWDLFQSELPEYFKIQLCKALHDNTLATHDGLCEIVAPYLIKLGLKEVSRDVSQTLLFFLEDEVLGLQLFEAYFELYGEEDSLSTLATTAKTWTEKTTMKAISLFPKPLSLICEYGKRPSINNSHENLVLIEVLKNRRMISSFKELGESIRVQTKRKASPL